MTPLGSRPAKGTACGHVVTVGIGPGDFDGCLRPHLPPCSLFQGSWLGAPHPPLPCLARENTPCGCSPGYRSGAMTGAPWLRCRKSCVCARGTGFQDKRTGFDLN